MKIGFVDNSLWGQINFRGDLINYLSKKYEVVMISPNDTSLERNKKIKYWDLKIERKSKNFLKDLVLFRKLVEIYKEEKFDIIFHYTIKPNIYGTLAAKFNNQKSISIIPGLGYTFVKETLFTKIIKLMYKYSLKFADEVWFLNNEDKEYFISNKLIKGSQAGLLPGEGINLEKFKPEILKEKSSDKIIFLMVARVLWDKGFKEYVEAAEKLLIEYPNVEFQLLGMLDENNPSGVPKEIVNEYDKKGIIKYLGETNQVAPIIHNCDCLVLPSFYREGLPRTLLEGAAMEKPLITTDNIGCRDLVDNGINGYLCEIKNSIDLAKKVEKMILLKQSERIEMGKKSRKKIEQKYGNNLIFNKYLEKISEYENKRM